jgi:hypothetical protein
MRKSFLCSLLFLTALSAVASPQQEPAALVDRLTGDCPRVWVYGGFSSSPAGERGGECKGSDAWAFYADNRLVVKMCRDKRFMTEEKRWSVEARPPGGAVLRIDDEEYDLSFATVDTPSKRVKMTLTRRPISKAEPEQKLIFYRYREIE